MSEPYDSLAQRLPHIIEYRSRRDGGFWHPMAAFDVKGPAEWYFDLQKKETGPWEYRLVNREADGQSENSK